MSQDSEKELDKAIQEFMEAFNSRGSSKMSEERIKLALAHDIILESFALGNYKFSEIVILAKSKLGAKLSEHLRELKMCYSGMAANISDEVYNKMNDLKTVRVFKLNPDDE
jgi:hypothetical protein